MFLPNDTEIELFLRYGKYNLSLHDIDVIQAEEARDRKVRVVL